MTTDRLAAPERRRQILEVARTLFARHGYEDATTEAIAAAAGISEPVIYRHFPNKAALYQEALTDAVDELLDRWHELRETEPPERWLLELGAAYQRALRSGPWSAGLQIDALAHARRPQIRRIVRAHHLRLHEFLSETIALAQARGSMPPDLDPDVEAWTFVALGLLLSADHVSGLLTDGTIGRIATYRHARLGINGP